MGSSYRKARSRVRFERHSSRVVFDPSSSSFVVTWTKCNIPVGDRLSSSKDPMFWMPSVSSIADLCERGCVDDDKILGAAYSIGRAYDAGDREMLDTDGAKKAAEMVRDLASMKAGKSDIRQSIRHLLDEIANVKFMSEPQSEFDRSVLEPLYRAWDKCMSIEGFSNWQPSAMRRKFLFCLGRKSRTPVAYTLIGLLFDTGSCPLLSIFNRRIVRMISIKKARSAREDSSKWNFADMAKDILGFALEEMASAKELGLSSISAKMTQQQQLADSLTLSSAK